MHVIATAPCKESKRVDALQNIPFASAGGGLKSSAVGHLVYLLIRQFQLLIEDLSVKVELDQAVDLPPGNSGPPLMATVVLLQFTLPDKQEHVQSSRQELNCSVYIQGTCAYGFPVVAWTMSLLGRHNPAMLHVMLVNDGKCALGMYILPPCCEAAAVDLPDFHVRFCSGCRNIRPSAV